ncbi:hypothetical protein AA23498_0021 [Acetobacter nitrogenifigens DSM 23921 = NBRC 105050]|uniref:DUF2938 domain-containing protein n=1 Tax=Acetobacter nitrogenifigens DSM 23921 = NBRC 105050 TaxID=1120919 RepID=A0A511X940_9PROT|nr:DUF2938 family protein [Acetobacter nitrogenifigens]GBQ86998.1 hypothetical protein AA23498_0021 [Acetobacter nitrogenifigens DSM 23921 = NBRC 105050]GEN59466.1 hypothetical protein ANI02nite_13500 [Acetobacter nitrogenifigens DSM 23921 = NBRC 105050]
MQTFLFIMVVGVGSTLALDLWGLIARKMGWLPGAHWPSVGRWLLGLPAGRFFFDGTNTAPNTTTESVLGWAFHYAVGLAYAAMLPLFWGADFIRDPGLGPCLVIGLGVSTVAGLGFFMPAMGGGLFARKTPSPPMTIAYVLVAHAVFALAQFALALALALALAFGVAAAM